MPLHNRKKKVYKNDEVVRKWENKEEGRQINGAFVSVENIFLKAFLHILVFYTTENVFFFKLLRTRGSSHGSSSGINNNILISLLAHHWPFPPRT